MFCPTIHPSSNWGFRKYSKKLLILLLFLFFLTNSGYRYILVDNINYLSMCDYDFLKKKLPRCTIVKLLTNLLKTRFCLKINFLLTFLSIFFFFVFLLITYLLYFLNQVSCGFISSEEKEKRHTNRSQTNLAVHLPEKTAKMK